MACAIAAGPLSLVVQGIDGKDIADSNPKLTKALLWQAHTPSPEAHPHPRRTLTPGTPSAQAHPHRLSRGLLAAAAA
eukprot:293832-Prymnesium_polylepis.1